MPGVKPGHDSREAGTNDKELVVPTLNLPVAGGATAPYTTKPAKKFPAAKPPFNRIAYAAAHVVADPRADNNPWLDTAIDWDATIVSPAPVVAWPRRR
jgi:hypothetical protein